MGFAERSWSIVTKRPWRTTLRNDALPALGSKRIDQITAGDVLAVVTELFLWGNELTGQIPSELSDLTDLTWLDLGGNELSGQIPSELSDLDLTDLSLSGNRGLSGPLPGSFTALNSLEYLRLDGTELCAPTDAAFQAWVRGIRYKRGVVDCASDALDRAALVALYNATDGPNWVDKTNWLSNRSFEDWFGVDTDNDGRVIQLPGSLTALNSLEYLRLEGTGLCAPTDAAFQAWLGGIRYKRGVVDCASDALDRAALVALYNATDGPNWVDKTNWLSNRSFEDWFGVDTDNDGRVTQLSLSGNQLGGQVPSELSGLANLTELDLGNNQLSGAVTV